MATMITVVTLITVVTMRGRENDHVPLITIVVLPHIVVTQNTHTISITAHHHHHVTTPTQCLTTPTTQHHTITLIVITFSILPTTLTLHHMTSPAHLSRRQVSLWSPFAERTLL